MIKVVLFKTLELADELSIDPKTRGLALDCYNELLNLLDFKILPGIQIRKAECLLQMVRHYTTQTVFKRWESFRKLP